MSVQTVFKMIKKLSSEVPSGKALRKTGLSAKSAQDRQRWDAAMSVDERRDEILKGLGTVLRERGFGSPTMKEVADKLGLVKGNLYYYFKNKQDLIYHCHLKCMRISLEALESAETADGPAQPRLRQLIVSHIRGMTEESYGAVLMLHLESLSPPNRKRYVAMRDRFEKGIRKLIEDGMASGEFRQQDPRVVGFATLGAINWIPTWYRPNGELSSLEVAESFADFFVGALR
jgi:AcrR family transcriptional regulator